MLLRWDCEEVDGVWVYDDDGFGMGAGETECWWLCEFAEGL